jgi:hypothetical protein
MRCPKGIWKSEFGIRNACLFAIILLGACRSEKPLPPPQAVVVWKPVGSWSGHGDKQTETFTSDTG